MLVGRAEEQRHCGELPENAALRLRKKSSLYTRTRATTGPPSPGNPENDN